MKLNYVVTASKGEEVVSEMGCETEAQASQQAHILKMLFGTAVNTVVKKAKSQNR